MEDAWDWVQEELKKIQDDMPVDSEMMQVVDAISVADFWKRRYDEEQMLWEKKLEVREDEKKLLQEKAQEHEMAIKELDFKLKELERRWQHEKLLLEDRLKAKESEATLAEKESRLEARLQALEEENKDLKSDLGNASGMPVAPPRRTEHLSEQTTEAPKACAAGPSEELLKKSEEEARLRLEKLEAEKNEVARALAEKEKVFVSEKEKWEKAEKEVGQMSRQMTHKLANLKEREEEHFVILEDLARGFAHRVRNYLGIMSGTIQLSLANYKMEQDLEEQLKVVDQSVQDMLKSIEDFLGLARIPEMNIQPIDIRQMLAGICASFADKAKTMNVALTREIGDGMPLFRGDQRLFIDAFQHLLDNALEAMPQGGQLSVSAAYEKSREAITIRITDTGAGISETHIKKVFQPYFSSKKNRKGLGLTIAKRVIDLHRGTLSLESAKDKGTTISINLYMDSEM